MSTLTPEERIQRNLENQRKREEAMREKERKRKEEEEKKKQEALEKLKKLDLNKPETLQGLVKKNKQKKFFSRENLKLIQFY